MSKQSLPLPKVKAKLAFAQTTYEAPPASIATNPHFHSFRSWSKVRGQMQALHYNHLRWSIINDGALMTSLHFSEPFVPIHGGLVMTVAKLSRLRLCERASPNKLFIGRHTNFKFCNCHFLPLVGIFWKLLHTSIQPHFVFSRKCIWKSDPRLEY